MRIYVGHAKQLDYRKVLYEPLRNSALNSEHEIVLPHEDCDALFNSKDFLETCDVMIAEVSYPATGLGIELGWADCLGCPIICIYKKGSKASSSLKAVSNIFLEYSDEDEMIALLTHELKRFL
jgi:nucleoside 2-deoxyribosyltransferase